MTIITDELIVRRLCEECGYELLDFRRSAHHIGITVCDIEYGVPLAFAMGDNLAPLPLGDDTLDSLRDMLTGGMEL